MFHRLTTPAYFILGGGPLPGGYDYINNLGGTPAPADSAKVGGPNAGSYFITFGEDATSADANRPAKALAQNCDFLDDLLHRDIAVSTRTGDTTAGSPLSSVILTGPNIFLGPAGTPNTVVGIVTVFHLLDANDEEIVNTGVECQITAVAGGVIGSGGFSAGNVTLTISPAIPTGTIYRVYYATRTNLADLPIDALTNIKIRGAEEVPGELIGYGGSALVGSNALPPWADTDANPAGTLFVQLTKILNDLSAVTGDEHIGSDALPPWRDASIINNAILNDNIDQIVGDLAADAGSARVGSAAVAVPFVGAPFALIATSVLAQLTSLLGVINQPFRGRVVTVAGDLNDSGFIDSTIYFMSSGFSFGLPDPALNKNRRFLLIDAFGGFSFTNTLTLTRFGAEKINRLTASFDLVAAHGRWVLVCDGTDWYTF